MIRFEIGDKVTVRNDLHYKMYDGGCEFNRRMDRYRGKTTTIKYVSYSLHGHTRYSLVGISDWVFTDSMLKSVETSWKERLSNETNT